MTRPDPSRSALLALAGEGFLSRLSSGVIGFALPLYALELGLGFAEISVLISLNLIIGIALKPLAGPLVDRIGSRVSSTVALGARSGLYLLFAFAAGPFALYAIQGARGVTKAARDPALYSLLAVTGGKKRVARTFGWYQAAKGSAGSLGHAVAGFLLALSAGGFGLVFAAAAAIAFLPCVLLPLFVPAAHGAPPARPNSSSPSDNATAGARKRALLDLAPFMGFGFLVSASSRMIRRMMPLLLVEYAGLAASEAGVLYVFAAFIPLVAAPLFGWFYDRISPAVVLQARSALNAASSLLYIVSPTLAGFAAGKLLDKSGTSAFGPAWGALMTQASSADPSRRASRMAMMTAAEDAGTVSGPILAGMLWSAFGPVAMLSVRLGLSLASGVYTLFLVRWLARRGARLQSSAASGSEAAAGEQT